MSRILRSFSMVTSWYTSACSLWSHAKKFLSARTIQVDQFRYNEIGPFECRDEEVATILRVISRQPDSKTIQRLRRLACTASVHAEAVLMGYAYYEPSHEIFASVSIS